MIGRFAELWKQTGSEWMAGTGHDLHIPENFKKRLAFFPLIGYNCKCFRDVAQVVERYFREVEAASSSLVIPI